MRTSKIAGAPFKSFARPPGSDLTNPAVDRVFSALQDRGLLLQQDRKLPNVVETVTGETLSSSWWSHPKGRLIFAVLSELADHPDVLFTKLLYGKVTLVHRRLWPALLAVGRAHESWQTASLSAAARRVLETVDRENEPIRAKSAVVKELEPRLLAVARQIHTNSGRHELVLLGWRAWATNARCRPLRSAAAGKKTLEEAASRIGAATQALPWNSA